MKKSKRIIDLSGAVGLSEASKERGDSKDPPEFSELCTGMDKVHIDDQVFELVQLEDAYRHEAADGIDTSPLNPARRSDPIDHSKSISDEEEDDIILPFKDEYAEYMEELLLPPKERFKRQLRKRNQKKRIKNHRCYYCKQPGHMKKVCIQRITKSEFMIKGTDQQSWNDIWFVSLVKKNHVTGSRKLFKKLKQSPGVETRIIERTKTFTKVIGRAEINGNGTMRTIEGICYAPSFNRNVLSLEQLVHQGYEVTFEGTICYISKMFGETASSVDEETLPDPPLDKDEEEKMLNDYFEALNLENEKQNRLKGTGKEEEEIPGFTQFINKMEDCITFLDLLKIMRVITIGEEKIKEEFNRMIKWFVKYYLKQDNRPFPPVLAGQEIDLYNLYMIVQTFGGYNEASIKGVWSTIAYKMEFNQSMAGIMDITCLMYLELLEHHYNEVKNKRPETVDDSLKEKGSSSMETMKKRKNDVGDQEESSSNKKKRVQAVRDWPPQCGPAKP